jgi:hypothetical protein
MIVTAGVDHLAPAERHVAEAETRVARQAALVAELRADGHDTATAERLLDLFTSTLSVMREHLRYEQAQQGLRP